MFGVVRFSILVAVVAVGLSALPSTAQSWSAKAAFSTSNPSGNWSFGYIDDSGTFTPYNTRFSPCQGIVGWDLDDNPDKAGNVTINTTSSAIEEFGIRWEPGQLLIHPGLSHYSVAVRWTAPVGVSVNLQGLVTGQHIGGAPALVKLRLNGQNVVAFRTSGFAGRGVTEDGRTGDQPEVGLVKSLTIARGDIIDLVVARDGDMPVGHVGIDLNLRAATQTGDSGTTPSTDTASPLTLGSVFGRQDWLSGTSNLSFAQKPLTNLFTVFQQRAEKG